ncbi:squalene synthase HpnD [Microbispora rosea subsp. aerata]|nr:squalene/phytoene synthase family protein [Microbispora rosea]GGO11280.1 squalene synthase HpnD [Microbispora rosea subsp. aerata]GIH53546.1 squalene synthase HpnD [Microbispora rosea subsp. aerata]GLJ86323.1 squalene synthase HpnD [Microbispora rosea subsp. aerata]
MTAPGAIPDPVPDRPPGPAPRRVAPVPTPVPAPVPVPAAYRHCEHVVRTRARNFAYGIRLLAPPKRRALSALYAFARRIDDIGDAAGPVDARLAALERARAGLRAARPDPADPVLVALRDTAARFPVPLEAFEELIDGCAADVAGARYQSYDDLVGYCREVAGSIGRLSLGVFGLAARPPAGEETLRRAARLADSLGVALQLTNVLRDLREDRCAGRVYLPADDLDRFGCTLDLDASGAFADPPERLARLIRYEAGRALGWYAEGMRLIPLLDRRSAACTAAMAGIYRRLLARIAADPGRVLAGRLSLTPWAKAIVAARAIAGAGR